MHIIKFLTRLTFSSVCLALIVSCGGGGGGGGGGDTSLSSPATPTYTIISGNIYTSPIPDTIYIDQNLNGIQDSYEISTSPNSSNGSFSFTTSNQSLANCLKNFPIASDSPLIFEFNDRQGANIIANAFTTILKDSSISWLPIADASKTANDNVDCSTRELYKNNYSTAWTKAVIGAMETYDSQTYQQIAADPSNPPSGSKISNQKSIDLNLFYKSLENIEGIIINELNNVLTASGTQVDLNSRIELDYSNFRIFLNDATYPNPSTDTSPVAQNIDSIAVEAGIEIFGTFENYTAGYDNTFEVKIDNMHISNNNEILQDTSSCWINFSSLCKVDPSFLNLFTYATPTIIDTLHKDTSRGEEKLFNLTVITDSSSLSCYEYDYIELTDSSVSDVITEYGYTEYLGQGNYNVNDLNCYAYGGGSKGLYVTSRFADGSEFYLEVWYNPNAINSSTGNSWNNYPPVIFENLPYAIDYDFYDDEDPPPVQLEQSYIDMFIDIGDGGWSSFDQIIFDGKFDSQGTSIYLNYRNSEGRQGYLSIVFDPTSSNDSATCDPIDAEPTSGNFTYNDIESLNSIINDCRTELTSSYTATSTPTYNNKSPYRGLIND